MNRSVISARALTRTFVREQSPRVEALRGVDLELAAGEFVSIVGASGSGKSTLLHLLGLLDRPSSGTLAFEGRDVSTLDDRARSKLRGARIGFVFQTFNLIPQLDVQENVLLPSLYSDTDLATARANARHAIERVGLAARATHLPAELSGGEQQRVAIARALAARPALVLADEPTGNLDRRTGESILALFEELHAEGTTLVVVTHDPDVAARAARCVRLVDGCVAELEVAR